MQPFTLEPLVKERVWGGGRIAERFGRPACKFPAGESWEVHGDLRVREGPWAGQRLDDVVSQDGPGLFGGPGSHVTFPVLTKWLDCQDWLSVQVHPDDATAQRLTGDPQARGKFECWFFLEVADHAEVIHGWRDGVPADLEHLSGRAWLDAVARFRPQPEKWLTTPAGCVHALGPGLFLYEVQQSSDLTYRLYDWDRPATDGREMHLEQGAEAIRAAQPGKDFFTLRDMRGEHAWTPVEAEILTCPHEGGRLVWQEGSLNLRAGDSAILPATSGALRWIPEGPGAWMRVLIPAS